MDPFGRAGEKNKPPVLGAFQMMVTHLFFVKGLRRTSGQSPIIPKPELRFAEGGWKNIYSKPCLFVFFVFSGGLEMSSCLRDLAVR